MLFEQYRTGYPVKAFGYRWQEVEDFPLNSNTLEDPDMFFSSQLHFCDDPNTWSAPWLKHHNLKLYLIHFDIRNPLVMLNCKERYESMFNCDNGGWVKARSMGYDAIIYTPIEKMSEHNVRQGCLLYPSQQIVEIELLQGRHY